MNISRENIVYKIVLMSILLTPVGAFFDLKAIELLPFFLLLVYVFSLLLKRKVVLNFNKSFYLVMIALFFYILFSLVIYKNIASIGSVSVFILSIIFYKVLDYKELDSKVLVRSVSYIYAINILFIIIEIVLRKNGYEHLFVEFLSAVDVKGFKDYNSAALFNYFGIKGGGANSLLLGSQSASMLTFFSLLWFSNVFIGDKFQDVNIRRSLFFLVSLFLYPFVATMTVNVVGILLLFFLFFLFDNSKLNKSKYQILLLLLLLLLFDFIYELVFYRIKTKAAVQEYSEMIFLLPNMMLSLDYFEIIFGSGRGSMTGKGIRLSGDFGLMHIAYEAGFFFISLVFIVLSFVTINVLRFVSFCKSNYPYHLTNPWVSLMSINLIIALGWFISLSHYTTSIETGGRFIFALHIALILISKKKIKRFIYLNNQISRQ